MDSKSTGSQSETWSHWESDSSEDNRPLPAMIGRYRVRRLLGRGAFGRVFLAFDEQIPAELERICLKALSQRASQRYTTALRPRAVCEWHGRDALS